MSWAIYIYATLRRALHFCHLATTLISYELLLTLYVVFTGELASSLYMATVCVLCVYKNKYHNYNTNYMRFVEYFCQGGTLGEMARAGVRTSLRAFHQATTG